MRAKPTTPQSITPRLTTAKRAAQSLGIPYTSLRMLAYQGEFPIVKIGRAWYLETAILDRWIETRREHVSDAVHAR